jgi:hypothetical protein
MCAAEGASDPTRPYATLWGSYALCSCWGPGAHVALVGELDLEVGEIVLEHLVLGLHELQLLLEVGEHLVRVRVRVRVRVGLEVGEHLHGGG